MDLPEWWPHPEPYAIMDCIEGMKALPDGCVDAIITDPPYGIGESMKNHASRGRRATLGAPLSNQKAIGIDYGASTWDAERMSEECFSQLFRVGVEQVIFGGNYYSDLLPPSPCWLVWDKENGNNDFSDCELIYTSFKTAVRCFRFRWQGMLQGDMANKERKHHPTQKPIPLLIWIMEKYTSPGAIVLDPFLGSGTTLRACRETGRVGLGFEIDPQYEGVIRKRALLDVPRLESFGDDNSR